MAIEWSDNFSVGDKDIDEQHQHLFRLVNRFLAAGNKVEQGICANHLFQYTRNHFGYEETIMRRVNFDEYDSHVWMHEMLIARLRTLSQHINDETLDRQELEEFVQDWALGHIPKADARLASYLGHLEASDTLRRDLSPFHDRHAGVSADAADTAFSIEVIEGNADSDWAAWEDSVFFQESQMQALQ
jgi:hemerythrin-like metal-binding protein